jgi:hypothetical protein
VVSLYLLIVGKGHNYIRKGGVVFEKVFDAVVSMGLKVVTLNGAQI